MPMKLASRCITVAALTVMTGCSGSSHKTSPGSPSQLNTPATVSGRIMLVGGPLDGSGSAPGPRPYSGLGVLAYPSGKIPRRSTTDSDGRYQLVLVPGIYKIVVPGASTRTLTLRPGEHAHVDADCPAA